MSEGLRPPFVEPDGVSASDEEVLAAFASRRGGCYSERFHLEGPALIAGRAIVVGLRIGSASVLVRTDLPDDVADARTGLETALAHAGMTLLDEETLWATPVALQVLGLRLSSWDLWGYGLDTAFAELRAAAAGEEASAIFEAGPVAGCE